MSVHGLIAQWSWLLLSSRECSLLHCAKVMIICVLSWVVMSNHDHSWLLLVASKCEWVLISVHGYSLSSPEQLWTLISLATWSNEQSWELKSSHEYGAMLITALELSWLLIAPCRQTHECSWLLMTAPYSWVLTSADKRWYALIRAHEHS